MISANLKISQTRKIPSLIFLIVIGILPGQVFAQSDVCDITLDLKCVELGGNPLPRDECKIAANTDVQLLYTITNSGVPPINYIIAGDDNATPVQPGDDVLVADGSVNDPVASGDFRVFSRTTQINTTSTFAAFASAQNANDSVESCGSTENILVQVLAPLSPSPVPLLDGWKIALLMFMIALFAWRTRGGRHIV